MGFMTEKIKVKITLYEEPWVIVCANGEVRGVWDSKEEAEQFNFAVGGDDDGDIVVRLHVLEGDVGADEG